MAGLFFFHLNFINTLLEEVLSFIIDEECVDFTCPKAQSQYLPKLNSNLVVSVSQTHIEWSHITSFGVFSDIKVEYNNKTSLACLRGLLWAPDLITNVKPPCNCQVNSSDGLVQGLSSVSLWHLVSPVSLIHQFLHYNMLIARALGEWWIYLSYPYSIPLAQNLAEMRYSKCLKGMISQKWVIFISTAWIPQFFPSNLSSIIIYRKDFMPSTLIICRNLRTGYRLSELEITLAFIWSLHHTDEPRKPIQPGKAAQNLGSWYLKSVGFGSRGQHGVPVPATPFTSDKCQFPHLSKWGQYHLPHRAKGKRREIYRKDPALDIQTTAALLLILLPPPKLPHWLATEPGLEARPPAPGWGLSYYLSFLHHLLTFHLHAPFLMNTAGQNTVANHQGKYTINQST